MEELPSTWHFFGAVTTAQCLWLSLADSDIWMCQNLSSQWETTEGTGIFFPLGSTLYRNEEMGSQKPTRTSSSYYRIRGQEVHSEVECLMTLAVIPALGQSISRRSMLWTNMALTVSLVRMRPGVGNSAVFFKTFSFSRVLIRFII